MIAHQFCELNHRSVWTDPIDAFMHRVFDFHGGPPSLEFECTRRNAASAPLPRTRLYNASSLLPGGSTVRTGDDLQRADARRTQRNRCLPAKWEFVCNISEF